MPASQQYKVCLCHIITQEIADFCGEDLFYGTSSSPGGILLDGRLLHNHTADCNFVCGRVLGLMPASQRYKIRLCRIKAQEIAVFCGGCVRYHPSRFLLDGWLLHDHRADLYSVCGGLLGSMLAWQRYKVHLCCKTQEIAIFCRVYIRYHAGGFLLDGWLLYNHRANFNSVCGRLLGSMPASQQYKVHLCGIKTQKVMIFYGGGSQRSLVEAGDWGYVFKIE